MCERAEHVQSLVFYALLIIETCILYTPAHRCINVCTSCEESQDCCQLFMTIIDLFASNLTAGKCIYF